MENVATHFSAAWEYGEQPPDAYVTIAGQRIAVDVAVITQRANERDGVVKPRLRFDRVALRFTDVLRAALSEFVPDGQTVVLTITAPIRLAGRTAAALENRVRDRLAHQPAPIGLSVTINGNQVRVHCLDHGVRGTSKVIGFAHNPDSDAGVLVATAESLLRCIGADAGKHASTHSVTDHWLVIVDDGMSSRFDTYRQVYSQLLIPTSFARILVLSADNRIETLAG